VLSQNLQTRQEASLMTECSAQLHLFPLVRKPVVARFDGGALSSDAGVTLLAALDRRLGLSERLARCLMDGRDQGRVRHQVVELLRQRIYQIACGYEDCNDADGLRGDPALKIAVGRLPSEEDLASQPTLSRLENGATRRALYAMSEQLVAHYCRRHRDRRPRTILLDADATDDETHGHQQLSFFHGFYDEHCYLPLLVFAQAEGVGEQELLAAVLRPGNVHAGHSAMAIIERIAQRLRGSFPRSRLLLRGDSGLALPEVYDGCEALRMPYIISLAKNPRLLALAEPWLQRARAQCAETGETAQVFGELSYAAESWPHPRRVIVKAEVMPKGDNPRFVVTSLSADELDAEAVYDWYRQRGDPENRIKELKVDLSADRLSCHRFLANQFRLLLHAAAYLLMQAMRAALAGTELARAQAGTLRLRVLKVGARVIESCRRVSLRLPTAYPWPGLWHHLNTCPRAGPS
jgi:hypothetical protein